VCMTGWAEGQMFSCFGLLVLAKEAIHLAGSHLGIKLGWVDVWKMNPASLRLHWVKASMILGVISLAEGVHKGNFHLPCN